MKKTRKIAAMVAAMALAATMVLPGAMNVSAAGESSITINANGSVDASKHTFAAYQIFTGTLNSASDPTGFTGDASSVNWGTAITDSGEALISALRTEAEKTGPVLSADAIAAVNAIPTTSPTAYDVSQALSAFTTAAEKTALADIIASLTLTMTAGTGTAAASSRSYGISGLDDGYYFVKDTTAPLGENDAFSKYILQVAGSTVLSIKTDAPTLEKKIWHNDSADAPNISPTAAPTSSDDLSLAGWNDVGDNKIGDTVYYYVETSVPDMSAYDTYKYIIRDSLSAGLTMESDGTDIMDIVYVPATGGGKSIKTIEGITVTMGDDTTTSDTETFSISFGDLKTVLTTAEITPAAGDKIYTYYHAQLNASAAVSAINNSTQNNPNTAWLTYSNNPNQSGSGDTNNTSDTPKDTVYDWTYTFDAEKLDEKNAPLAGAAFKLCEGTSTTGMSLVEITFANYQALVGETTGTDPGDTKYFRPAVSADTSSVTTFSTEKVSDTVKYKFKFVGLDDTKEYSLIEESAPSGYAKKESATKLKITDAYTTAGSAVNTINKTVDGATGSTATIINYKGSTLPSTGGIGTKLFVFGGGMSAALAGIYLISRKRAKDESDE
jgi:fimbrial isopeptide formation D2 family protein/LPXTG-motif cell wall-anchored protein